jgi:hypothetical protein
MDFRDIVTGELLLHKITLCTGCQSGDNHPRGIAYPDSRIIHYSAKCATRSTLHGFLHEVGHIVLGHGRACKLKRWEKEAGAEDYARYSMRTYGISIPRRVSREGREYVDRMARWGRNIAAGRRA